MTEQPPSGPRSRKRLRHALGALAMLAHVLLVGLAWWLPASSSSVPTISVGGPPDEHAYLRKPARPVQTPPIEDLRDDSLDLCVLHTCVRHIPLSWPPPTLEPLNITGASAAGLGRPAVVSDDPAGPRNALLGTSDGDHSIGPEVPSPSPHDPGAVAWTGPSGMGTWCPGGKAYR